MGFRDILARPRTSPQNPRINFTDPLIELGYVIESVFDIVYDLDFACMKDYYRTRGVLDFAEKWKFDHVTRQVKDHFLKDKYDNDGMSMERLTLGIALGMSGPVFQCLEELADAEWGVEARKVPEYVNEVLKICPRYLHDTPVPQLLGYEPLESRRISDLGTW